MIKITLKKDGSFEHFWPKGDAPKHAISVDAKTAKYLSINPESKRYDQESKKVVDLPLVFSIDDEKRLKINSITNDFNNSISTINIIGIDWVAGIESGIRLKYAKEIAEMAGLKLVTFTDSKKQTHELTILDADKVIKKIGVDFQDKFILRQKSINIINNLPKDSTQLDVDNALK